jgi:hypothetical protein
MSKRRAAVESLYHEEMKYIDEMLESPYLSDEVKTKLNLRKFELQRHLVDFAIPEKKTKK